MKKCTLCLELKELSGFFKNRTARDGFSSRCKPCSKIVKDKENATATRREYENRPEVREYRRAYRRQRYVLDKVNEYRKKPAVKAHRAALARDRRKIDPQYAIHGRVSCMIRARIKCKKQGRAWKNLLPYSLDQFMKHLERQFLKGMGWHNMSEWEIDHILPQSSFSFSTPEDGEFRACWALTNLRPLWGFDNQSKKNKRLFLL